MGPTRKGTNGSHLRQHSAFKVSPDEGKINEGGASMTNAERRDCGSLDLPRGKDGAEVKG